MRLEGLYDIYEVLDNILYILLCHLSVKWKCHCILEHLVGIGKVLNVETESLIGSHHR